MKPTPPDSLRHIVPTSSGPVVIGATGGSGTRVVARIVQQGGMFIGTNLNESSDAIDFGEFSTRWINQFLNRRNSDVLPRIEQRMIQDLTRVLEAHCRPINDSIQVWGWKEPRSIYLLPFFHRQFPDMRFIHVLRDGRDMAFSQNQNQLRKHGRTLLSWRERLASRPVRSITLWSRINQIAADYGESIMKEQYFQIRFEDLCASPVPITEQIFNFVGLTGDVKQIASDEVKPPQTSGRWRLKDEKIIRKLHQAGELELLRFGYLDCELDSIHF